MTTNQVLFLSTTHVSKATGDWLDGEATKALNRHPEAPHDWPAIHVAAHLYGWWLYCDENPAESWPDDVRRLMGKVLELGCDYVCLDADEPPSPDLPTFDW